MKRFARVLPALVMLALLALPCGGCATILGTAVSPITGGVDLTKQHLSPTELGGRGSPWVTPLVFLGGMLAGPFVALYNGVNHDVSIFQSWGRYWGEFGGVFKPFDFVNRI